MDLEAASISGNRLVQVCLWRELQRLGAAAPVEALGPVNVSEPEVKVEVKWSTFSTSYEFLQRLRPTYGTCVSWTTVGSQ